jgi:hypothetical protein
MQKAACLKDYSNMKESSAVFVYLPKDERYDRV